MKQFLDIVAMKKLWFIVFVFPQFLLAQSLDFYRCASYGWGDGTAINFVSLADGFVFRDHKDSLVIAEKYLGNNKIIDDNYHQLDSIHRHRFLSQAGIRETDKIFVFDFNLDTVFVFPVKNQEITAFITPYGTYKPIPQFDYMIGFDLTNDFIKLNYTTAEYSTNLVYVGPGNPFVTGKVEKIKWKISNVSDFPNEKMSKSDREKSSRYQPIDCYSYSSGDYVYYLRNLTHNNIFVGRHLLVLKNNNDVKLSNFYFETEGSYLTPLNNVDQFSGIEAFQYTGAIIRMKPRIVFGFLGQSFGCNKIDFISKDEPSIYIRCDNRH